MPEHSPGQRAYATYLATILPSDWRRESRRWDTLPALEQAAWEAAAQAVLAQWWQAHEAIICGDDEEDDDA